MNTDIDILQLPNAWQIVEGFPQPDWKLIGEYIRQMADPENLKEAWDKASLQWLGVLKAKRGPDYAISESSNFLLLTNKSKNNALHMLSVAEDILARIRADLKDLAWHWEFGRYAIVTFEDLEEYYLYIAYLDAEGDESATSGGILPDPGYCHTALFLHTVYEPDLVRELARLSVSHLAIPRWLHAGLMASTGDKITRRMSYNLDGEILELHRAYWNHDTIQDFWSGKSFTAPGDPSMLSFGLAEVLVNNMRSDFGSDVHRFVLAAKRDDAGESAALEHLGVSLSEVAATFLGDGDWTPVAGTIAQ